MDVSAKKPQPPATDQSARKYRGLSCRWFEIPTPVDLVSSGITPIAKVIYLALLSRCHERAQVVTPGQGRTRTPAQVPAQVKTITVSQRKLARELGIERHTLCKHVRELVGQGWLSVEPAGAHSTRFTLCYPALAERWRELEQVQKRLDRAPHVGEALMKEWLTLLVDLSEYDDNARPGFLCNPTTGENLEYDRWYAACEGGSVAFEFNGPQHYRVTGHFPDSEQVAQTRARDYIKKAISQDHGVTLITIHPEDLTFTGMLAKIEEAPQLPLRTVYLDDPVLNYIVDVSERYIYRATGKRARY
ncbi:MAG TPA: hypothetical protein GXX55_05475 [Firmicutes bacterium]|nr:hypothetical protein [Bacillota bacterium]